MGDGKIEVPSYVCPWWEYAWRQPNDFPQPGERVLAWVDDDEAYTHPHFRIVWWGANVNGVLCWQSTANEYVSGLVRWVPLPEPPP